MTDIKIGSLKEIGAKPGDTVELVENGIYGGHNVGCVGVVAIRDGLLCTKGNGMDRGDIFGHKFKIVDRYNYEEPPYAKITEKKEDVTMTIKVGSISEIGAKVGDIVECVRWKGDFYTEGNFYPVIKGFGKRKVSIGTEDIAGDWRIISRASDTPKLWRDMTPEEKGALLLAAHDGRDLEYWRRGSGGWASCSSAGIYDNEAYRVKPQPKVENVVNNEMYLTPRGCVVSNARLEGAKPITLRYTMVDGVIDLSTYSLEYRSQDVQQTSK